MAAIDESKARDEESFSSEAEKAAGAAQPPRSGVYAKHELDEVVIPPNPVPRIDEPSASDEEPEAEVVPLYPWTRATAAPERIDLDSVLDRVSLLPAPRNPFVANVVPHAPPAGLPRLDADEPLHELTRRASVAPPKQGVSWPAFAASSVLVLSLGAAAGPIVQRFLRDADAGTAAPIAAQVASNTETAPLGAAAGSPSLAVLPQVDSPSAPVPTNPRTAVAAAAPRAAVGAVSPASASSRPTSERAIAAPAAVAPEAPVAEVGAPVAEAPAAASAETAVAEGTPAAEAPAAEAAPEAAAPAPRTVDDLLAEAANPSSGDAIAALAPGRQAAVTGLPQQPSRADVQAAMRSVASGVRACATAPGTAMLRITFGSEGAVTSAAATGTLAGTSEGSCMADAVKSARVSPFSRPSFSVSYPFAR